jgi:hypothetical protein
MHAVEHRLLVFAGGYDDTGLASCHPSKHVLVLLVMPAQSVTRVKPFITTMPLRLDEGWNQIQFNLSDFVRRAYGKLACSNSGASTAHVVEVHAVHARQAVWRTTNPYI